MTFDEIIKLAEEGDVEAMVAAVQEFVWKEHVDVKDSELIEEKTNEYLLKAILRGSSDAMNQLGAMYAEGRMVEKDPKQAYLLYKMASERYNALAISNLGFCYLHGNGTEQNYEEAYKAFSKAALLGIGDAIVRLGDMFLKGLYVAKDEYLAIELYTRARNMSIDKLADWGMQQVYSDVCLRLADCYMNGIGMEKNVKAALTTYAEAVSFFTLREEKGDSYSSEGLKKAKEGLQKALEEV